MKDVRVAAVSQIVAELFTGPEDRLIDVLVGMVAYLLDVKHEQIESLDDPSPAKWHVYFVSSIRSGESYAEANELLTLVAGSYSVAGGAT